MWVRTETTEDTMNRTEIPTTTVECSCKHCAEYAGRKGLTLPLRAEVNEKMAAVLCGTAKGRHTQVKKAHAPLFGRYDDMQAKFGPWAA